MPAISIIKRSLRRITFILAMTLTCSVVLAEPVYIPTPEELAEGQVEIVAGENRTVFEYRVNGRLLMIKVVPKVGASYYMVPADGQPHYESLDEKKKLYPQWVLIEF